MRNVAQREKWRREKMATRLHIQKEVFSPADERLIGLVSVTKPGRKKRPSFLCASGEGGCLV